MSLALNVKRSVKPFTVFYSICQRKVSEIQKILQIEQWAKHQGRNTPDLLKAEVYKMCMILKNDDNDNNSMYRISYKVLIYLYEENIYQENSPLIQLSQELICKNLFYKNILQLLNSKSGIVLQLLSFRYEPYESF